MEIKSNTSFFGISSKIKPNPIINNSIVQQTSFLSKEVSSIKEIKNSSINENKMTDNLAILTSRLSNSNEKETEINSGDIDRLNNLQKITTNSYASYEKIIKSAISLSNISSDIDELSDGNEIGKIYQEFEQKLNILKDYDEEKQNISCKNVPTLDEKSQVQLDKSIKTIEKIPDFNSNRLKNIKSLNSEPTSAQFEQSYHLKKQNPHQDESAVIDHKNEIFKIIPDPFGQFRKDRQTSISNEGKITDEIEVNSSFLEHQYLPYKIIPDPFSQFSNESQNEIKQPKHFIFEQSDDENNWDAVLPVTIELLNH